VAGPTGFSSYDDQDFERRSEMGIISWIILGLIAGFIGSKIVDKQGQGLWLNIALGIVGALVGGFLFDLFGAAGVVRRALLRTACNF
jgi:uncharacterized membrane protein YeaQ/YmgE (transglycosylase-associated protein family)